MEQVTQALLDTVARTVQEVIPVRWEACTYRSRATASGTATDHAEVLVQFAHYSEHYIALQALTARDRATTVLREDMRLKIATADVTWTPTVYDEVIRATGEHWRVMDATGGAGHAFWQLRGRKLPPS